MSRVVRAGTVLLSLAALFGVIGFVATMAMDAGDRTTDVSGLAVGAGEADVAGIDPALLGAKGEIQVAVRMVDAPLAVAVGRNAKQKGAALDKAQQKAHLDLLSHKQDALMGQIRGLGGRELGRVSKALNAVLVSIDASRIKDVAALPGVRGIRAIRDYELDLSGTVPYIGASAVHAAGFDGSGVRVAILDSGIDYTHANLGGSGLPADYFAAYGVSTADPLNTTLDGLFPTAKVVGGFDFVGEMWPTPDSARCGFNPNGTPRACVVPDPDPIDCGPAAIPAPCAGSHGTHVADIVGGNDGAAHKGVAPGASLYAVKVCSAVATSCSGIALLNGMDFALDPNGDGDISDAVDVVNMSLGSAYGQQEDDLYEASANAVRLGVVVVAAAGNNADRPYITSSPAAPPEVISAAQTQVPYAKVDFMTISPDNRNLVAVFQPWSVVPAGAISAPVQYGNGTGGNLLGCAAFPAGSLAGKIVLVDRGSCNFSLKTKNIGDAGGLVGVIGLVAAGAPFEGAFGGDAPQTVPGYMISLADSNLVKSRIPAGVVATFDPANFLSLAMSMVSTSARGPSVSLHAIKPDIGAPGASISAVAGSGTGSSSFGGTSGATPMISGSAALLIDAYPARTPSEIKAALMNTAETNIQIDPTTLTGELAPITRIGGGEVRVNRALNTTTAAWDDDAPTASLSFGYQAMTGTKTFNKTVRVRNYGGSARTYTIAPGFRYANDAASGAVTLSAPASVSVPANGSKTFKVQVTVNASLLPTWTLNGGSRGGDGFRLQGVEFDGYIGIADATDSLTIPWHILPHRAAAVSAAASSVTLVGGSATLDFSNATGAVNGRGDAFALLGTSGKIPPPNLPDPGDNFAIIDLRSFGARLVDTGGGNLGVQFAVNTFGARAHPNYPAEFDVYIDNNLDGAFDYVVFNRENGTFGSSGQNVTSVFNLTTGVQTIRFFTDADLDSANAILTARLSDLGLTAGTQFGISVFGCDNYFTGNCTDAIQGMTYTLGTPRYVVDGGLGSGVVPVGGSVTATISAVPGGDVASPSQTGVLFMLRDSKSQQEAIPILVF